MKVKNYANRISIDGVGAADMLFVKRTIPKLMVPSGLPAVGGILLGASAL